MAEYEKLTKLGKQAKEEAAAEFEGWDRDRLMEAYVPVKAELEMAEGKVAYLKEAILAGMVEEGMGVGDDFKIDKVGSARIQAGRKTVSISAQKLLERGVSSADIEFATEEKEGNPYIVITVAR